MSDAGSEIGQERSSPLRKSVSEATRKIEGIIDAAEAAAAAIRDEAAVEAASHREEQLAELEAELDTRRAAHQRHLEETARELGELVGPLVAWVDELREATNQAVGRLRAIATSLTEDGANEHVTQPDRQSGEASGQRPAEDPGSEPPASEPQREEPQAGSGPQPVAYPGRAPKAADSESAEPAEGGAGNKAEALLLATQLAVSGVPRPDIKAELEASFGLEDATSMLDELLGPQLSTG